MSYQNEQKNKIVIPKMKCNCNVQKILWSRFILNDESYFKLTHSTFNDSDSYYTSDVSTAQPIIKFDTKLKFEDKILVWLWCIRKTSVNCSSECLRSLSRANDICKSAFDFASVFTFFEITTAVIMSSNQTSRAVFVNKTSFLMRS